MELIDRYLHAVGFWLPKKQKKDILAELEADLRSEIEDREAGLGRKLEDAEVEELLKRHGSPILMAGRYQPQRSLVGPVLFPIYKFVLKMALFVYLVPWMAVWLFMVAFIPSFRAAHPGPELLKTLSSLWNIALTAFAFITINFAVAEWLKLPEKISGKWTPRKLPKERDVARIPRSNSIAEIVFGLIFIAWWLGIVTPPAIVIRDAVTLFRPAGSLWPAFHDGFLIPVALLSAIGVGIAIVNLARPVWSRLRLGLHAAADGLTALIVAMVLLPRWQGVLDRFNVLRHAHPAGAAPEVWTAAVDFAVFVTLLVIGLSCLGSTLMRILRIIRWRTSQKRP
jgi:hypothetical protein